MTMRAILFSLGVCLLIATNAHAQCRVDGVVRSAAGAPIAGATIQIDGPDYRQPLTTTTDAQGKYEFRDVKAGTRVRIVALSDARPIAQVFALVTLWVETVDLKEEPLSAAGGGRDFLTVSRGAAGALEGYVRSPAGEPVADARVTLGDTTLSTTTDAAGRYAIAGLRPGVRIDAHASAAGFQPSSVPLTVGQEREAIDFTLTPAANTSEPIPTLNRPDLFLFRLDPASPADSFDTLHGDGLVRVRDLPGTSGVIAKPFGFVDGGLLGGDATIGMPAGDRFSWLVAARRSPPSSTYDDVLDRFAPTAGVSARTRVPRFSGGAFADAVSDSYFRDIDARLDGRLTGADRVSFTVYDGVDRLNRSHDLPIAVAQPTGITIPVDAPPLPADAVIQAGQSGEWTSRGIAATWMRRWSPGASTTVSVGRSQYSRSGDQAWLVASLSSGSDLSFVNGRGGSSGLAESNHLTETTMAVDGSVAAGFAHAIAAGAEISSFDVAYASQTEALRALTRGSPASTLVELFDSAGTGTLTAAYARDAWRPTASLTVTPGIRVAQYSTAGTTYFEPRGTASYELVPGFRVTSGFSIDHQVVYRLTREDRLHGDGSFWALADGARLPVPRTRQVSVGGRYDVQGVVVEATAYTKQIDDASMLAPRLFPGLAPTIDNALLHHGSETARGIETQLEQTYGPSTLRAAYTLSKAEATYPTLEAATFPASQDRTHQFRIAETLKPRAGWTLTGAFVAATGRPYTPALSVGPVWTPTGITLSAASFGPKNSARLPAYYRLDASAERDWTVHGVTLSIGALAVNLYDRQNVRFYEYETAGALTPHAVPDAGRAFNGFLRLGL